MSTDTLPVAEIFKSPQGEGRWAGTYMAFVRLAGCNVGKPFTQEERSRHDLQVYQEKCHDWQGNEFACDTNYIMSKRMSIEEIMDAVGDTKRICLTGGEPLMHYVRPLLEAAFEAQKYVHIETSGTKLITVKSSRMWICISPKQGYIKENLNLADEIKLLIGFGYNEEKLIEEFGSFIELGKVCISPVNGEHDLDRANMKRCLALQVKYPDLRLSLQSHKIWGVR